MDLRVFIKHLTGNVHAVAVLPDVVGVTLYNFFHHPSLACDRKRGVLHCLWLFLDTHSITHYGEPRNLAIVERSGQMLSDLMVIKPDSTRVHTTESIAFVRWLSLIYWNPGN